MTTDRDLHRLHDDDLSADEKAELEKEIAADPASAAKLEGLREVGLVVRSARTDEQPIDSDVLWAAIEGKIASATPLASEGKIAAAMEAPKKPPLRAIEGGAAKTPAIEDPRARRRRVIGIAVGAFAIAAAALFVVYGTPEPETVAEVAPPEPALPDTTVAEADVEPTDYTEVLAVDFGTNVGTIFAVEGAGGQRYAVVWLDDVLKRDEGDVPSEEQTPD